MSTKLEFDIWLSLSILAWIECLIQIYGIYRFRSIQKLVIISKRYPRLVLLESIGAIIMELIVLPLAANALFIATNFGLHSIDQHYFTLLGLAVIPPSTHFIANLEACRLWLIQYDLQYLHASKNEKWKSQINVHFSNEPNWYLRNKHKYGNQKRVVCLGFIWYITAAAICSVLFVYLHPRGYTHLGQMIDGMFLSVPLSITLYTYYKCPKYSELNDNLMFYYEFRINSFLFFSGFIFYFVSSVMFYIGYVTVNHVLVILLCVYTLGVPSLVSTLWIPRKIADEKMWRDSSMVSMSDIVMMHEINSNKDEQTNQQRNVGGVDAKLKQIMPDERQFEALVHWMYREFSAENILCFIEMVQYKQMVVRLLDATEFVHEEKHCEYEFYATMPKSSIVYHEQNGHVNDKDVGARTPSFGRIQSVSQSAVVDVESPSVLEPAENVKRAAHDLFDKYVRVGAEFEVNMSALRRKRYTRLDANEWQNRPINEMLGVFDDVIEEVYHFIRQSYIRSITN